MLTAQASIMAAADDGTRLAYKTYGSGPTNLLFMHGWAGSGDYFSETIAGLNLTGLRAITYDLRGHGASDKPSGGYTLDQFAQDALAVCDHAGASEIVIVGYSMSAKFAQYLACVAPERVRGLILVAPVPVNELNMPIEIHEDWVSRAGDRERIADLVQQFMTIADTDPLLQRFTEHAALIPAFVLDETLRMCERTSFSSRLSSMTAAALFITGKRDVMFTPEQVAQNMVPLLPHARIAMLDCTHEIPMETPDMLAALIEAFVAGLASCR